MDQDLAHLVAANVAAVRAEIAAACARSGRDPSEVRLVAVTKSQGPEVLPALAAAGVTDCGENRWEHQEMMVQAGVPGLRFHAIGRLQGRQLAKVAPWSSSIHSLAEADHLVRLEGVCARLERRLEIFLQVNASGEAAKAGVEPHQVPALVDLARRQPHLAVVGLMTMAPAGATDDALQACFGRLRDLARAEGLPRLSMGMSQDFAHAIAAGATDIRIGTRLFVRSDDHG